MLHRYTPVRLRGRDNSSNPAQASLSIGDYASTGIVAACGAGFEHFTAIRIEALMLSERLAA